VDLLFESSRLVYSRWQIQCKNTKTVTLDPVAKEVGLTHFLKSNVIIVVTTGVFTSDAKKYSNAIMKDSNLSIVLLDGSDIDSISKDPSVIVDILNRDAKRTMEIKKIEL
ncbi:MAG: restriction endonuclease, partial [Bacteroidales bacterium]|nr:restriction endonuclease [Bacteroidales bacterium]